MAVFKDKLQAFLKHYDKLNSVGEEADEGFNAEFIVSSIFSIIIRIIIIIS